MILRQHCGWGREGGGNVATMINPIRAEVKKGHELSREPQSRWLSLSCQLTFLFVKFDTTRYNYIPLHELSFRDKL